MLTRQTGGHTEAGKPDSIVSNVHKNIRRLQVFMNEASLMHPSEDSRQRNSDAQEFRYLQWLAEQSIERLSAWILQHQRHAVVVAA